MKILVVHLLRLGDVLQTLPVLEGLRARYPGATVDLLVFRGVDRLRELVPGVNQWWTLDREGLQGGLGEAEIPLLTALDVLDERVREIDSENYDLVINLSHTEFSARLAGLIRAEKRIGAWRGLDGRAHLSGPWFEYLDRKAKQPGADVIHHLDVFWHGCDLGALEKKWTLNRTAAGRAELAALGMRGQNPLIACQPFTSDVAKDWGPARWVECLNTLRGAHPEITFAILAAPDEAGRAREISDRVAGAEVSVTSLAGALAVIDRARLLLTGDTSIKHLAAASETPMIELCLGPSEFRRTGGYRAGYVIVTAAGGRPENISPALVAEVAAARLAGRAVGPLSNATAQVRGVTESLGFFATEDGVSELRAGSRTLALAARLGFGADLLSPDQCP